MLISYKWLQEYFAEPLPAPDKVADLFTFRAFEIEGLEKKSVGSGDDTVLDIKVLPDRAHYALSHRGIASELAAILDVPRLAVSKAPYAKQLPVQSIKPLKISVENELCVRYIGRMVENVSVADSPAWLKEKLEAIGQRSINTLVDATNYVMFDVGQPLHAFDADKVKGGITVRLAKADEKITTLDGKEIALPSTALVIADDEGPLAIAGVKGGVRAQVAKDTKNIILESANFNPASVRKTSSAVGIKNDSSKRFENGITPELAPEAMNLVTSLIASLSPDVRIGEVKDVYTQPQKQHSIEFSAEFVSTSLGVKISEDEIIALLERLEIHTAKEDSKLIATIPFERLDLVIPVDLVEEVGRLYGYEKIQPVQLPALNTSTEINKQFYWEQKVRTILAEFGFSEVYNHSLVDSGVVEIQNPLASDKCALRTDLSKGIQKTLELNTYNAPLVGIDQVRIFEIGKVFDKKLQPGDKSDANNGGEHLSLVVALGNVGKVNKKAPTVNEQIREVREKLLVALGANIMTVCTIDDTGGLMMLNNKQIGIINNIDGVMEFNLDAVIDALPEPKTWDMSVVKSDAKYAKISSYPFALRDIAVFVPENLSADEVLTVITKEGGELLVRHKLFDIFTKKFPDGTAKTSYAFSLVFQSQERTLSDDEINAAMKRISDVMTANGWQVR